MKLSNETLYNAVKPLGEIAALDFDTEVSFLLTDALIACQDKLRAFDKMRERIIAEGTKKDEEGKPMHPEGDASRVLLTDDAATKLGELLKLEVELGIEAIPRSQIKGVKIQPATLVQLSWLFKK